MLYVITFIELHLSILSIRFLLNVVQPHYVREHLYLSILSIRFETEGRVKMGCNPLIQLVFQFYRLDSLFAVFLRATAINIVNLSILSIRFGASCPRRRLWRRSAFQFYRLDSLPPQPIVDTMLFQELSILSIRFRTLDPPSLSFRFRFRIELT